MVRVARYFLRSTRGALALATVCMGGAPGAAASISGVCPDGSMFIVQRAESIPCRDAKAVEPGDLPPMKPEYLPRPYGWELLHRKNDPNNPYNLIQQQPSAPAIRVHRATDNRNDPPPSPEQPVIEARIPEGSALQGGFASVVGSDPPMGGSGLDLADSEVEDLAMIVELSQRGTPASFTDDGSQGRVRFARSLAFEVRLRDYLAGRGHASAGPVVLFVADADSGGSFYGNLTFVQNGIAFHPSNSNPLELGVIRGRLGSLENGDSVLGYVVLPDRLDPSHPIDVFWNDRQLTATFQP